MTDFPTTPPSHAGAHNHRACVTDALARAEAVCARRGLRLTPIRRRVLELIWQNHKPAKAYDLLDQIRSEQGRAAPPTVYRALDFLLRAGLAHHLESVDAFVGCGSEACGGTPQFLICRRCQHVVEMKSDRLKSDADTAARLQGFVSEREVIELHGLCAACRTP